MLKFQVSVTSVSREKVISLIKSLRTIANLDLKDAKDIAEFIVSNTPCILVAGIDRDVADHVASLLLNEGATATVEESSLTVPLFLCPQANRRYQSSWLGGRVAL